MSKALKICTIGEGTISHEVQGSNGSWDEE